MEKSHGIRERNGSPLLFNERGINMKIWVPNELILTVLLGKENASKRMRDIFEKYYGEIDKAFTGIEPEVLNNKETNGSGLRWD